MNKNDLQDKANAIAETIDQLADAIKLAALTSAIDTAVNKWVVQDLARAAISLEDAADYVKCAIEELDS